MKRYIAVIGRNCITASGIAPVEFAYQTLKKLDLFFHETLRWWYELYRTRETKYFYNLMESLKVRER